MGEKVSPDKMPTEEINPAQVIATPAKKAGMPLRTKIMFWLIAWFIVLMPFLFWRATWFGRPLTDGEMQSYLHDDQKPRHVQHALVQLGERMSRHENVDRWYPDLLRLANYPVEEVRNTDAWVMGQDTTQQEFHAALLKMLQDPSVTVRSNAALALVRFGDTSGRQQILEMLQPTTVTAPVAGTVGEVAKAGEPANHGTEVVKMKDGQKTVQLRSPITGNVRTALVRPGAQVNAGDPLLVISPGTDQVWEALRALYLVGQAQDLGVVRIYERGQPNLPDRIAQQAKLTEQAILQRAK